MDEELSVRPVRLVRLVRLVRQKFFVLLSLDFFFFVKDFQKPDA